MSKLLFNSHPLVIDPDLAKLIGLNEAIIIQQIHYWIEINKKAERNFYDNRYWTYNTIKEWHEKYFPFWSFNTVHRTIQKIESMGILLVGSFNQDPSNRTKWYTIDYEVLGKLNDKEKKAVIKKVAKPANRYKSKPNPQNEEMPKSPKWGNAYPQNGEIYKQAETSITETKSIHLSDKLNTEQEIITYVRNLIGYDGWNNSSQSPFEKSWMDNVVSLLAEIFSQETGRIRIAGALREVKEVKKQLACLKPNHLCYLAESLEQSKPEIKNIKGYILTSLYNAPNTVNLYSTSKTIRQQKEETEKNLMIEEDELRKLSKQIII